LVTFNQLSEKARMGIPRFLLFSEHKLTVSILHWAVISLDPLSGGFDSDPPSIVCVGADLGTVAHLFFTNKGTPPLPIDKLAHKMLKEKLSLEKVRFLKGGIN